MMHFHKVIKYLCVTALGIMLAGTAFSQYINGEIKNDTEGKPVNAHGGGVIYHNGIYYWFGEIKKGNTWLVTGQQWECYRVPAGGVSCYSSKDLINWKNEGVALAPLKGDPSHDLDTGKVIERPKVIYNPKTKKFVMWMHVDAKDYSYSQSGVAVSDRITGPYKYLGSVKPNGQMSRDMTLFKDDDDKAYLVYSSEFNKTMHVCLLSDDYLSPTTTWKKILVQREREAPAMFRYKKNYYLITSACTGWSPNPATYAVADNPLGPWKEYGNPCTGPDAGTTFNSQSSYVLPVQGKPGSWIFMADRWNKLDLEDSRYLWLPLKIEDDKVVISANSWVIGSGAIDPGHYYGITAGNGMLGIVSSPEPFKVKDIILAGTYDLYGRGRVSNFVKSFNLLDMYLEIDGDRIGSWNANKFEQRLDMQHGAFTGSFEYGDAADVSYTYYALRQLPYTALMDITVTARRDLEITSAGMMQAPDALRDVQNYYNELQTHTGTLPLLTSAAKSPSGKWLMCASSTFIFNDTMHGVPRVTHEMWDNNMHLIKFTRKIKKGESYTYCLAGSSITSAHTPDPLNEAERLTIFASLEGRQRLLMLHEQAWEELWKSDIVIEGDEASQRDIRNMLYHLYSFVRAGSGWSISPMGLSGLGYNGHVFWDAELWMYPVLLILHPEMAESMIEYRYQRLEAARRNALSHGFKGAMFPWESADAGVEETPVWALTGPFEHHITACVGIAAWNYYCVTQDKEWLKEKGWPLLSATADFWTSRVERNGPGKYDIKNVVASDEWAENIDNDAWTNAAAKANLRYAIEAAKVLGIKAGAEWQAVADNIPILKMEDGVTKEHAGYHGENIKQADVNLLAYPLKEVSGEGDIRKDLEYYITRVPSAGTPAMSKAIFSLLYARLGDGLRAFELFKNAYEPNKLDPFGVLSEAPGSGNPYFATGAGGLLQAVVMGFAGLDITAKGVVQVVSAMPPSWKSITITITGVGPDKKIFIKNATGYAK